MSSSHKNTSPANSLTIAKDIWLGGVMSRDVFRVSGAVAEGGESEGKRVVRGVTESPGFCYARVPPHDITTAHLFERCGFSLVDTGVTLEAGRIIDGAVNHHGARLARADDRVAVEEIARHSFMFSRFHLDPNIPRQLADEIKAQWVGNYFAGQRGDHMIVAEQAGEVAGFLQLLRGPGEVLVIDLIAVAERYRGQGLAAAMIRYGASTCGRPRILRVGTQIANTASLGLYQKIGFRIVSSNYIFHHHQTSRQ